MKKIILIALLIISANAYECSTKSSDSEVFTTMSNTFKDSGNTKSMWIESKKIAKGKIIETSKQKIEIQPDKNLRVIQGVIYDKNGNIKKSYSNGDYARFEEVIPGSIGEWMWHIITNWKYFLANKSNDKKLMENNCIFFGYSEIELAPTEEQNEETQNESIEHAVSMTPEQTQKWLEENDPKK